MKSLSKSAYQRRTGFVFLLSASLVGPLIGLLTATGRVSAAEPKSMLAKGDRVVFIGDALIEQEQYHGWIELELTRRLRSGNVIFRNLGWSGDTPAGKSRTGLSLVQAGYEPEGEGWRQLQKQIKQTQPTVALIGYGMASALEAKDDGVASQTEADQFVSQYNRLIGFLRKVQPDCRLVCLSPITPVGKTSLTDDDIRQYQQAVQTIARDHQALFIDLSNLAMDDALRKDPIHLNDDGYRAAAQLIAESLVASSPDAPSPTDTDSELVGDLKTDGPSRDEMLRKSIIEKNRLWFHRSRPANMAYVFGFRKREQGQNAIEIPQYDPLIEQLEQRIAKLSAGVISSDDHATATASRLESKYAKFTPQSKPEF
ncbi:MAG: SGNH/GDSL hydrolase family protein, partial [Planctomycetota bacterium]